MLNKKIPEEALHIIKILNHNGFEAYIVGGCVRDSILDREPKDWDITTSAKPREVKALFDKTVDTGIQHGTVTVVINACNIEVTTFRIDGKYQDNRRPLSVEFAASLEDDLSRRDFTVNAIAYHPDRGYIDVYRGMDHIKNRLICAVGNAGERFREDALRMLRAVRFSAQLNFRIDENTMEAIKDNSFLIKNISWERIRDELTKILTSDHPGRFILLRDTGLLQYILPEFEVCFHTQQNNPYHIYNVAMHTLNSVMQVDNSKELRWAMLLHDIGKPLTKTTDDKGIDHFHQHPDKGMELAQIILKRLKFDNKTVNRIKRLIKYHDRDIKPAHRSVRKALNVIGQDIFEELLRVKEADRKAQNPQYLEAALEELERIWDVYNDIKEKQHCIDKKDLAVNGHDLMDMGIEEGKEIRDTLDELLSEVIDNPGLNSREKLIALVRNRKQAGFKQG